MSEQIILTERNKARFDVVLAKELIAEDYELFKTYIKMFFFKYESDIFFFDGTIFKLMNVEKAKSQLPIDLCHIAKVANPEKSKFDSVKRSARYYIETVDFSKTIYRPTINFKTTARVYDETTVLKGMSFGDKCLNMAKPYNIDIFNRPKKYKKGTIEKLALVHDHILNVICGGNKESNEYLLNWIACTMNGRKVRKAIYIVSAEGTGKGILVGGLFKTIMGVSLHKTSLAENIVKYTKPFEGSVLLNLDELPASENRREISDCLKSLITEATFPCRDV